MCFPQSKGNPVYVPLYGRDMRAVSELLSEAINSIVDAKEESDIDSLFKPGGTSALMSAVSGLDDFELICFLVVRQP